jgi:serine/threonine protein phosphatase PrpC
MQYEIGRTSRLGNRETNQDSLTSIEMEGGVMLVLGDGLGGSSHGEVASQALIDTVNDELERHPMPIPHPESFLEALILQAHYTIQEIGESRKPPINTGTTAVLCLVQEGMVWWAHAGDSRCYLFRNGIPLYRTKDHSYVEELYEQGQLTIEKKEKHPMRNLVTQCIGLNNISPDVTVSKGVPLQKGDILLLCSDGFWEPLDDAQMGALIDQGSLNDSLNKLAERAEKASYPKSDNTSAVALKVISLQDIHKKTQTEPIEPIPEASPKDPLSGAINEIERAIEEYSDEMKK